MISFNQKTLSFQNTNFPKIKNAVFDLEKNVLFFKSLGEFT